LFVTISVRVFEFLAWTALAAISLAGLPLFICMAPWLDVTLYDVAARTVLRGGVPYRDIFDTNLPGPLWVHLLVRATLGYRSEVIRIVDIALVGASILLLVNWLRPLALSRGARVGLAFVLSAFYLSTPELCHCQRDVWMLLPALAALYLRRRQVADMMQEKLLLKRLALRGVLEGFFWAAAFWIKPFVAVPALACWLVAALQTRRAPYRGIRLAVDAGWVLLGGLAAGGAGVAWMMACGAWEPFLHVLTVWNPEYAAHARAMPLQERERLMFGSFQVWDLLNVAAVPLALLTLFGGFRLAESKRNTLVLLAAFYLAWLGQVVFLQQMHEYIQVPPLLIGLTFLAGSAAAVARPAARRIAVLGFCVFVFVALTQHPLLRWNRLALWPRCWREGSTAELRNRLSLVYSEHNPDWTKLEEIADYLRSLNLKDGELTCYNDSTHPIYLNLDLEPSTPFLHFGLLLRCCPGRCEDMREALAQSRERYVVSDVQDPIAYEAFAAVEASNELALPPMFPTAYRDLFPWTEPIVFRRGRYLVHRVTGPVAPLLPNNAKH
jgi:hypothetical protein